MTIKFVDLRSGLQRRCALTVYDMAQRAGTCPAAEAEFGVKLAVLYERDEAQKAAAIHLVTSALRLLKAKDPLRYRRVKRYVAMIVFRFHGDLADYLPTVATCVLNFTKCEEGPPEDRPAAVAGILVHEAMRARLFARRITARQTGKLRFSDACDLEMARTLRRLIPSWPKATA